PGGESGISRPITTGSAALAGAAANSSASAPTTRRSIVIVFSPRGKRFIRHLSRLRSGFHRGVSRRPATGRIVLGCQPKLLRRLGFAEAPEGRRGPAP